MDDFGGGVCFGVVISIVLIMLLIAIDPNSARNVLDACLESLPRDQYCELTAVPKEVNDD